MTTNRVEARKEQILRAAEKVFAKKGFQESTIADIVKEAKISDATLYEYFSSKEELLFSIPRELTLKIKEQIEFHLEHVRGAVNKIRSIIYDHLWFWQNNPDYASVALLILKQNRKFKDTDVYKVIYDTYQIIVPIVKEGIESGELQPTVNPKLVLAMQIGTIEFIVINKLLQGIPENLLDYVDPITDQLLGGILKKDDNKNININISLDPESNVSVD